MQGSLSLEWHYLTDFCTTSPISPLSLHICTHVFTHIIGDPGITSSWTWPKPLIWRATIYLNWNLKKSRFQTFGHILVQVKPPNTIHQIRELQESGNDILWSTTGFYPQNIHIKDYLNTWHEDTNVHAVENFKYLVGALGTHLTFDQHCSMLSERVDQHNVLLWRFWNLISNDLAIRLHEYLIHLHFCCSHLYYGYSRTNYGLMSMKPSKGLCKTVLFITVHLMIEWHSPSLSGDFLQMWIIYYNVPHSHISIARYWMRLCSRYGLLNTAVWTITHAE